MDTFSYYYEEHFPGTAPPPVFVRHAASVVCIRAAPVTGVMAGVGCGGVCLGAASWSLRLLRGGVSGGDGGDCGFRVDFNMFIS